uniref:Uncharacterized protein n=1 Tax=Ascaris lumbricoides TaxID=6252 RepID=A0A0M3IW32_ASCLU
MNKAFIVMSNRITSFPYAYRFHHSRISQLSTYEIPIKHL